MDTKPREHRLTAEEQLARRVRGRYRAGIDGLIKKLADRARYMSDEQRAELLDLARREDGAT